VTPEGNLSALPFYRRGARRQNRTVSPLRAAPQYGKALRAFDRLGQGNGNEIAIPAVSKPKGLTMIVTESKRPTHRVYAVRKTGGDASYWAEIGAAWANKDGKGFNLKLNLMPVSDADIVIREIDAKTEAGAQ
jgi:uncharacterized protein (UPF0248 family)